MYNIHLAEDDICRFCKETSVNVLCSCKNLVRTRYEGVTHNQKDDSPHKGRNPTLMLFNGI